MGYPSPDVCFCAFFFLGGGGLTEDFRAYARVKDPRGFLDLGVLGVLGFWGFGFWGLGVLGFRGFGFGGFRVLGVLGQG